MTITSSFVWYHRYGLSVLSEVPLGVAVPAPEAQEPDLTVTYERLGSPTSGPLEGEVLAERTSPDGTNWYTLARAPGGYTLRIPDIADFFINDGVNEVLCREQPEAPAGIAEVIMQATVFAFLLSLRGQVVLHASAVSVQGLVYAVAGPSGSGKSTLAALLCAGGATLVADDLLSVSGAQVVGTGPGAELRLRGGVRAIYELFDVAPPSYETSDGRLAVLPPALADLPRPLAGVLLPTLTNGEELTARQLHGSDATVALVRAARITGWRDQQQQMRFFRTAVELGQAVPVCQLEIPVRAPFRPIAPAELLSALKGTGDGIG